MPNWCLNRVIAVGDTHAVNRLANQVRGEDTLFSLAKAVPMPADVEDWYQWSVDNWGTKWDVECDDFTDLTQEGTTVASWTFSSAWSPPLPALETLAAQHPTVTVVGLFDEPGMDFSGSYLARSGEHGGDEVVLPSSWGIPDTLVESESGLVLVSHADITPIPATNAASDPICAHALVDLPPSTHAAVSLWLTAHASQPQAASLVVVSRRPVSVTLSHVDDDGCAHVSALSGTLRADAVGAWEDYFHEEGPDSHLCSRDVQRLLHHLATPGLHPRAASVILALRDCTSEDSPTPVDLSRQISAYDRLHDSGVPLHVAGALLPKIDPAATVDDRVTHCLNILHRGP